MADGSVRNWFPKPFMLSSGFELALDELLTTGDIGCEQAESVCEFRLRGIRGCPKKELRLSPCVAVHEKAQEQGFPLKWRNCGMVPARRHRLPKNRRTIYRRTRRSPRQPVRGSTPHKSREGPSSC
jgi:hypothetical protein